MKGLLLKDWYLMTKYCGAFLLMVIVFIVVAFWGDDNMLFIIYPCVLVGMLPMTLCAYDEREKWCAYSQTLPVSKAQYVSAKYIIGLMVSIAVLILEGIAQAYRMISTGSFGITNYLSMIGIILSTSLITPSILMPFVFKFGTEKARIIYYVGVAFAFAAATISSTVQGITFAINGAVGIVLTCAIMIGVYVASWLLSIVFYKKREI